MENEWEIEYVVNLVWIVVVISFYDYVVMYLMSNFWFDFRIWVGVGKYYRFVGY